MNYYIIKDDMRLGPFSLDEVRMQQLAADTLVWHKGMPDWKEACTLPELIDAITPVVPPLPQSDDEIVSGQPDEEPEPTVATPPVPQPRPRRFAYTPVPEKPKKKSKAGIVALIALLVVMLVVCIMMLTKPSKEDYIQAVTRSATEYMVSHISKDALEANETMAGTIRFSTSKAVKAVIEPTITIDDCIVFNKAIVTVNGHSFTVGMGVFGQVFCFGKEYLAQAVEQYVEAEKAKLEQNNPTLIDGIMDHAIDYGKEKAEQIGIEIDSTINEAIDSIKTKAVRKGSELVDDVLEKAKQKGKEKIDELWDELAN